MRLIWLIGFISLSLMANDCPLPDLNSFNAESFPKDFFVNNCTTKEFLNDSDKLCNECISKSLMTKFKTENKANESKELAKSQYSNFEKNFLVITNDISQISSNYNLSSQETDQIAKSCLLDRIESSCGEDSNFDLLKNEFNVSPIEKMRKKIVSELSYLEVNEVISDPSEKGKEPAGFRNRYNENKSCNIPDSNIDNVLNNYSHLLSIELARSLKDYDKQKFDAESINSYFKEKNLAPSGFFSTNLKNPLYRILLENPLTAEQLVQDLKDSSPENIGNITKILEKDQFKKSIVNDLTKRCDETFSLFTKFLCTNSNDNNVSNLDNFKALKDISTQSAPKFKETPTSDRDKQKVEKLVSSHGDLEWFCENKSQEISDFEKNYIELNNSLPLSIQNSNLKPQAFFTSEYEPYEQTRTLICNSIPPKAELASRIMSLNCKLDIQEETNYECKILRIYQTLNGLETSPSLAGMSQVENFNNKNKDNSLVVKFLGNTVNYSSEEKVILRKAGLIKDDLGTSQRNAEFAQPEITPSQTIDQPSPSPSSSQKSSLLNNLSNANKNASNVNNTVNNKNSQNQNSAEYIQNEKQKLQNDILNRLIGSSQKNLDIANAQNEELKKLIEKEDSQKVLSKSDIEDMVNKLKNPPKTTKNNQSKTVSNTKEFGQASKQFNNSPSTVNIQNKNGDDHGTIQNTSNNNISNTTFNNMDEQTREQFANIPKGVAKTAVTDASTNRGPGTVTAAAVGAVGAISSAITDSQFKVDDKNKRIQLESSKSVDIDELLKKSDKEEVNKFEGMLREKTPFIVESKDGFKVQVEFKEDGSPELKPLYKDKQDHYAELEKDLLAYLVKPRAELSKLKNALNLKKSN